MFPRQLPDVALTISLEDGIHEPQDVVVPHGRTVAQIRAVARNFAAAAGGVWSVYCNDLKVEGPQAPCPPGAYIKVVPGLVAGDMVRGITAPIITDLAHLTAPYKGGQIEHFGDFVGNPHLVYNPLKNEEFMIAIHESGDKMHYDDSDDIIDEELSSEYEAEQLAQLAVAYEGNRDQHTVLYNGLFNLAKTYPSRTTGKPRQLWIFNFDGREAEDIWDDMELGEPEEPGEARRRANLEEAVLSDVWNALGLYGGYAESPWPKPIYKFMPIIDYERGKTAVFEEIADLAKNWGENDLVVMHCAASLGRTGGVIMSIIAALNACRLQPALRAEELEATGREIRKATQALYNEKNTELPAYDRVKLAIESAALSLDLLDMYGMASASEISQKRAPLGIHTGQPGTADRRPSTPLEKENMKRALAYDYFRKMLNVPDKPVDAQLARFIVRAISARNGLIRPPYPGNAYRDQYCSVDEIVYEVSDTGAHYVANLLDSTDIVAMRYPLGLESDSGMTKRCRLSPMGDYNGGPLVGQATASRFRPVEHAAVIAGAGQGVAHRALQQALQRAAEARVAAERAERARRAAAG